MRLRNKHELILSLASAKGVIRAGDLASSGVSANYLYDLVREGSLKKVGRGMFVLPSYDFTEHHSLAEVAAYAPGCVICLLSALQFYGIGTQLPHAVWLAVSHKARSPQIPTTLVQVVRMSPASLTAGVEIYTLEGVPVRLFSAPKTIADCFKFRSIVGLDVAIEALKEGVSKRIIRPDELYQYAVIDRVWEVMRPYLEAIQ